MKYTLIYWSRYGNGKKIMDTLSETLKGKGNEVQILNTDKADPSAIPEADFYVFSAATEAFNIQRNMKSFMKKMQGLDGKKCGVINTHGMKRNWLGKMEKLVNKKNMELVASVDFRMGKQVNDGNGLEGDWEEQLTSFANKLS
jgi:flavorubredoxin